MVTIGAKGPHSSPGLSFRSVPFSARSTAVGGLSKLLLGKPITHNKKLAINRRDYIRAIIREVREEMRHGLGCTFVGNAFLVKAFQYLLFILLISASKVKDGKSVLSQKRHQIVASF